MLRSVTIGDKIIGDKQACFIIAEIGINHNGDINIARQLISAAVSAGCDAVKFQKRTIELVYSPEDLARERENPFGTTNGDLKRGLEFGYEEYKQIDQYCQEKNILWFASCWDEPSVDFMEQFSPPCHKISSASLTDDNLLLRYKKYNRPIILSTGMSTLEQIDHAVEVLDKDNLILLHCTATYPSKLEELNLMAIKTLKKRYDIPIGYSGHEVGLSTSIAAAALGACVVERHITLDRAMWGSDQAASIEPKGFTRLVDHIHGVEKALGDGNKRVYESEIPIMKKLRRVNI